MIRTHTPEDDFGPISDLASPATFRFANIGPIKDAALKLGRLTVIAGRNNTGKTLLANLLHSFLHLWEDWVGAPKYLFGAPADFPNIKGIAETLADTGRAVIPLDLKAMQHQRRTLLEQVGRAFPKESMRLAHGLALEGYADTSISLELDDPEAIGPPRPYRSKGLGTVVSMSHDGARLMVSFEEKGPPESMDEIENRTAWAYYRFLLDELLPGSFMLSSDRVGISLFHRELDFKMSEMIEVLHKLGDDEVRPSLAPILFMTGMSDRHNHAVNDNVDFTRHLAELRGEPARLRQAAKMLGQLRNMIGGYYLSSGNDIRFIARARGDDGGYNIPLCQASSSARGLSDLYFYIRHEAAVDDLLIIDCPESHLDTRNQVLLARLLAELVAMGMYVLITTHSDHLVKELNNLIMIHEGFPKRSVTKRLGYKHADRLNPRRVRAYVAEDGGLTQCDIGPFGIEMPVLDETAASVNRAAIELSSHVRGPLRP